MTYLEMLRDRMNSLHHIRHTATVRGQCQAALQADERLAAVYREYQKALAASESAKAIMGADA
jgi:hypothetical protein